MTLKNFKLFKLVVFPVAILLLSRCNFSSDVNLSSSSYSYEGSPVDEDAILNIEKQKGAHVFGHIDSTSLLSVAQDNYNWITLVAYGAQEGIDSDSMVYTRGDSLQMARRDSVWGAKIDYAHTAGFKVFLKPHIWLTAPQYGTWRSDIYPSNDKKWTKWQNTYKKFILHYAYLAQSNDVEMFCIGTELASLSEKKTNFWIELIKDVRAVYSGKITYASNWYQEFEHITFWDKLDYIGIQAYFPLTKEKSPSVKSISKGWQKFIPDMKKVNKKYNRKILFTELGYKSTTDSAIEPWKWLDYTSDQNINLSYQTQSNCYQAFFNTIWDNEWFAGAHIWQLRSDFEKGRGHSNFDFTPQGKPAQQTIAIGFQNNK